MIFLCAIFNMIKSLFLGIKNYFVDVYKETDFVSLLQIIGILIGGPVAIAIVFSVPFLPFIIGAIFFYKERRNTAEKENKQLCVFFPVAMILFCLLFNNIIAEPDLPTNMFLQIIAKSAMSNCFSLIFGVGITAIICYCMTVLSVIYNKLSTSFKENYNMCKNKKETK